MAAATIQDIRARRIFDGCARPSLEVVVTTRTARVRAAPSYSDPRSSGKYEITHFPKGGVQGSIDLINSTIRDRLIGMDACAQQEVDALFLEIDGGDRFESIGGNTAEATSMAVAKAGAASLGIPLFQHVHGDGDIGVPHQMPNIIGGGATMGDAGWKGRTPDIQDHVILPIGCQSTYQEMQCVSEVFHRVGLLLQDADPAYTGGRDEEYCWLPGLDDAACLAVLKQACDEVAACHEISFRLGLDVGAADLWDESAQVYRYAREGVERTPDQHARHLGDLVDRFELFYMEDSFFEDHVDLYREQLQQYGKEVLLAGDDLVAGDLGRLEEMAGTGAINAAVIKLNMAGTVTRTGRFVASCKAHGLATIGSCRTYDSPDDTLADLIVGWGCNTYKCGSPAGGEHAAKYNRFMRIDEKLGPEPTFVDFPGIKP
jgi:enolase